MAIRCGRCADRHATVADVRDCYADADNTAGEVYAEAVMSWVASGGNPADASRYARMVAAGEVWNGGITDLPDLGECEHGLSAALCAGPQHYPYDADERARGLVNAY